MADQNVSLVIAGGEISMGLADGIVTSQQSVSAETIQSWISPELAGSVRLVDWSHQPSSHYSVRMTADLVELLSQQVEAGAHAVVVFCGSDAVEEMAYLADLLWVYPQPLIFAATHAPAGVPGSDALTVLNEALLTALSREAWGQGVLVCAGGQLFAASDIIEYADYGRLGFAGNFRGAIGAIVAGKVHLWQAPKRSKIFDAPFTPARNVELLYASLGAGERFLQLLTGDEGNPLDGLVIAGFGGGHVYPAWVPYLKALVRDGVPVVVVSRCLRGCVMEDSSFEGAFLKLKEFGVMNGGFLSPLQARLKLAVGIGANLKGEELQKYLLDQ